MVTVLSYHSTMIFFYQSEHFFPYLVQQVSDGWECNSDSGPINHRNFLFNKITGWRFEPPITGCGSSVAVAAHFEQLNALIKLQEVKERISVPKLKK